MSGVEAPLWALFFLAYFIFNAVWLEEAIDSRLTILDRAMLGSRGRAFVALIFLLFGLPLIFIMTLKQLILGGED